MIVVSDTSAINYLVLIGRVDLLRALFGGVAIPEAVRAELLDPATPEPVRAWVAAPPEWLTVHAAPDIAAVVLASLHRGEREAIALAEHLAADVILIDERAARRRAAERGLRVTGLLGVLLDGASRGLVDLAEALERLRGTTFRLDPDLAALVLRWALGTTPKAPPAPEGPELAALRAALAATMTAHYEWLEGRFGAHDARRAAVGEIRDRMLEWLARGDAQHLPRSPAALPGDVRQAALIAAAADPPDLLAAAAGEAYDRYQRLQRQQSLGRG